MPNLKVSNPRGQKPKTFSGNETRKISIHQYASRQNVSRTYTSKRVSPRLTFHKGHVTRPQTIITLTMSHAHIHIMDIKRMVT